MFVFCVLCLCLCLPFLKIVAACRFRLSCGRPNHDREQLSQQTSDNLGSQDKESSSEDGSAHNAAGGTLSTGTDSIASGSQNSPDDLYSPQSGNTPCTTMTGESDYGTTGSKMLWGQEEPAAGGVKKKMRESKRAAARKAGKEKDKVTVEGEAAQSR